MDFEKDLRIIAEADLDAHGLAHLPAEDNLTVLRRWVNLRLRLIRPIPRGVFVSMKIQKMVHGEGLEKSLKHVEKILVDGGDVNPHLSKKIFEEDYTDPLFAEWAIHHLHLNIDLDPKIPYFIKRSDKLLFLILDVKGAYLIDIRDHDEDYVFAQKELLNIVHDEWPQVIEPFRLKGISVEQEFNKPEDIHKMRKAGVMIIHKVGKDIYAPIGGGLNTGRTSARMVIETDRLFHTARFAEKWARDNEKAILQSIQSLNPQQTDLNLHLVSSKNGCFIVDEISKTVLVQVKI